MKKKLEYKWRRRWEGYEKREADFFRLFFIFLVLSTMFYEVEEEVELVGGDTWVTGV